MSPDDERSLWEERILRDPTLSGLKPESRGPIDVPSCSLAWNPVNNPVHPMTSMKHLGILAALLTCASFTQLFAADWATYEGKDGPGKGKRIVFVTGDEEYRSEEAAPMLAKILSQRHGFDCTVLFCLNPQDGTIDPQNQTNLVGAKALADADMMVIFARFAISRRSNEVCGRFSGGFGRVPIFGIRTATHSFAIKRTNSPSPSIWQSRVWPGGLASRCSGDTWVNRHGDHGHLKTRGVFNESERNHPILKGVDDVWGPTDVYTIAHLPKTADMLVWGQVLQGMKPDDAPLRVQEQPDDVDSRVRNFPGDTGKTSR